MRESIQDFVRVNRWVRNAIIIAGLLLGFLVFGVCRGFLFAALFFGGLFIISIIIHSIWAACEIRRLRKGLAESEQDRQAKEEQIRKLGNIVERVKSEASDIREGTALQRMIELMFILIREVDSAKEFKRIEQAVGKNMFRVTRLVWRPDRKAVEARVVFGKEPPFVQGQEVDYYMASVRLCRGTVVRLDDHSATVELDAQPLPADAFEDLEMLTTMDVAEAYVALPVLEGLKGYTVEELDGIEARLKNAYQLLISLLEGGVG